jgi:hypothetical protein
MNVTFLKRCKNEYIIIRTSSAICCDMGGFYDMLHSELVDCVARPVTQGKKLRPGACTFTAWLAKQLAAGY